MKFTKMHGIGNDYIYINGFEEKIKNPSAASIILSDRHKGIGGDGLVIINPSGTADVEMKMYNADGSEGAMCGNAIRCVAKFAYERGLVGDKTELKIQTKSGIKTVWMTLDNKKVKTVTVDMGEPILEPRRIPVKSDSSDFINKKIIAGGREYYGTAVSMGNPHFVIFTDGVKGLDLAAVGPSIENHELFPDRINTEFVELTSEGIFMRVWERGSGETMACGTGASAVLVASVLNGKSDRKNKIILLGGSLDIEWREDNHVYMTGPAAFVYDGVIDGTMEEKINR